MKVLIAENEIDSAKNLSKIICDVLGILEENISISLTAADAKDVIYKSDIDLLLIDLNLKGENGFEVLKVFLANSESSRVIIVTDHLEKAVQAFEYGVLDFVPKPITKNRLIKALNRFKRYAHTNKVSIKYFTVKKRHRLIKIIEDDLLYFEGYGHYSKMHLKDGRIEVYDKPLIILESLLGDSFERVHKSYIVKMAALESLSIYPGGKYELILINGDTVPVGRKQYKKLKKRWF